MKIYIAAPEPNDLKIKKEILLSYYDIYIYHLSHLERKPFLI
jgi:hypothetical protein